MRRMKTGETIAKAGIGLLFVLTLVGFLLIVRETQRYSASMPEDAPRQTAVQIPTYSSTRKASSRPLPGGGGRNEEVALRRQLTLAQREIQRLQDEIDQMPTHFEMEYMGSFHATAYCCEVYPHICGGNGVTASGTVPTPGVTCAADWNVFPPGTWLYIKDVGIRRVEDSGSAIKGQRLDIAVDTHANALKWPGFGSHDVWVLLWPDEA